MLRVAVGMAHLGLRSARRQWRALANLPVERQARNLFAVLPSSRLAIDNAQGYARFSIDDINERGNLDELAGLAQRWKNDPARSESDKPFLRNIMQAQDLIDHPGILDIALNQHLVSAIATYLGQLPRLVNLHVWWTPPNQTAMRSQLFHYDHRDMRQAKVFINLNDVDETAGPLHFLSAADSNKVDRAIGYSQSRYSDEQIYSCCSPADVVQTIGPRGAAFVVDTARCLHYGRRQNVKDRLVLMASFARANCVSTGPGCEVLDPVRKQLIDGRYAQDAARRFILTDSRPAGAGEGDGEI